MRHRIISRALLAMALLLSVNLALAAGKKSDVMGPATDTAQNPVAPAKAKPAAKPARIDVNSASKATLMKLPGIGAEEAERIIVGRPYLTKSGLVTKNSLSMEIYQGIRKLVVAKQK